MIEGNDMMYKCSICGYIYDEKEQGKLFSDLSDNWKCPVCTGPKFLFEEVKGNNNSNQEPTKSESTDNSIENEGSESLDYLGEFTRANDNVEKHMDIIHEMAKTGAPVIAPMRRNYL
jgi:rubredoxin